MELEMMSEATITRIRIAYTKERRFVLSVILTCSACGSAFSHAASFNPTQGFHPAPAQPRFRPALGFISDAELLDFWMDEPVPIEEIHSRLPAAPPGLKIHAAQTVEQAEDLLQSQMYASEYSCFFDQTETQGLTQNR